MESLPKTIEKLRNLKTLDLQENPFTILPWSITELDSLEEILINGKFFKNLLEVIQEFIQNVKSQREKGESISLSPLQIHGIISSNR